MVNLWGPPDIAAARSDSSNFNLKYVHASKATGCEILIYFYNYKGQERFAEHYFLLLSSESIQNIRIYFFN